jgi:NAD(P) transhydrogenase subunit beta
VWLIAIAVAVGAVIAVFAARRVQMTQMPQLVAAFNGVGGGAAALVALVEAGHAESPWTLVVVAITVLIGSVSLTGSFVTFGKLQGIVTTKAVTFPGIRILMVVLVVAAVAAAAVLVATGDTLFAFLLSAIGLVLGVLLVLPIGGADVPIVISLLNAFTGLAVAASGLVLANVLLLIAGTLVGASGTILTMAMA